MKTTIQSLGIVAFLSITSFASAQQRDREQGRWTGKLKGLAPRVLQVESDKGERWLVAVEARPQEVSFQGSATPDFLRPGMLVQFRASIDKKGEAQDEIGEIKVVTQRMGIQLGLQADGGVAGGGLFESNDDDGNKKKKKVRGDASPFLVTGTLRSIKDGKMYVAAGPTVKAELSDNCQVSLDISDFSLAREGDNVEIEGWRYVNQSNQIYARRLTITADKPLGIDEKKRRPIAKSDEKKPEDKKAEDKKAEDKKDSKEVASEPK
jgi:hypothetical protein